MTMTTKTSSTPAPTTTAAPLLESAGRLLTDVRSVKLQLVESADKTGKVFVRGEFGRADLATENKRVYPRKLWEREFTRLETGLSQRQVFGELDHPTDGRTSLNRVSHIITNLQLGDDGIVVGEAEILDTERGKNLMAMLKAGCSVGVSSRGYGSTKANDKGEEIINFGKYKGQKVTDVLKNDLGYYGWMMNSDFALHTKKVLTNIKLRSFNK